MTKEIDVLAVAKQGLLSASHRLDSPDKQLRILAKKEVDEILEAIETHAITMQQVDLTDDEKDEIECALNMAFDLLCKPVDSIAEMYCFGMGDCDEVRQQLKDARAVIAADREKNK